MEMNWKDNCAEIFGSLVLTFLMLKLWAGDGEAGLLEWGVALTVLWAVFAGADILPVVSASKMLNDQDWEGGMVKIVCQITGAMGAGVLAIVASQGDSTLIAYAGPTDVATDLSHWVGLIAGGGLAYIALTRCEGWVAGFAIALAAVAGGAEVLTGGAHLGTMLIGLADGGTFEKEGVLMFVMNTLAVAVGAWIAVRVEAELDKA